MEGDGPQIWRREVGANVSTLFWSNPVAEKNAEHSLVSLEAQTGAPAVVSALVVATVGAMLAAGRLPLRMRAFSRRLPRYL